MNRLVTMAAVLIAVSSLTSCANTEDLKYRLERRNDRYKDWQLRRQMRQDARQERVDAWFDRVMH